MTTSAQAFPVPETRPAGLLRWLTTVDHKDIGIMYIITAFLFFLIGGLEALLIRIQLGAANNTVLSPDAYNQIFTMHGTTMIFLFAMPILAGFGNYLVPLMIGARDMAFPRLNALSYWLFLFGGVLLYSSFVLGGAPNGGWFAYAPLTTTPFSPTHGMDFWVMGVIITGVGSTAGALNLIVTMLNMRAPGMTLLKMPLFPWQVLVTSFLMIFAIPSLTADAILLFAERNFGASFFSTAGGGDPLLWQHLFWFFGHPEVYILILPAFGIISEVLPVFARKPIFGYGAIVYSGIAIGFLGFTVWAHHMFAVGMDPVVNAVFSLDSMIIAVPTSIKIFNWIATLWGGKINVKSPLLFAVGFVAMFLIGGLSGATVAVVPFDWQVTDTYYIVAHLHYVLFGGTVFAIFAGIYYWFPKMTGRMLSDRLGKWQFWTMLLGFNLTFFPMHLLGLLGMPRRIYTYPTGLGWDIWNQMETVGAFILAVAILMFLWNVFASLRNGERAGNDPWDAQTLEWDTTSPPPAYNFAAVPQVRSRRPLWDRKHPGMPEHLDVPMPKAMEGGAGGPAHVALPGPSFWPAVLAAGVTVAGYGMVFLVWPVVGIGTVITIVGIIGWAREPR